MSDPPEYLGRICRWLGLRHDADAIEQMMHPERSPFACFGPLDALFGNDPNFLSGPTFRPHKVKVPSLDKPVPWREDGRAERKWSRWRASSAKSLRRRSRRDDRTRPPGRRQAASHRPCRGDPVRTHPDSTSLALPRACARRAALFRRAMSEFVEKPVSTSTPTPVARNRSFRRSRIAGERPMEDSLAERRHSSTRSMFLGAAVELQTRLLRVRNRGLGLDVSVIARADQKRDAFRGARSAPPDPAVPACCLPPSCPNGVRP